MITMTSSAVTRTLIIHPSVATSLTDETRIAVLAEAQRVITEECRCIVEAYRGGPYALMLRVTFGNRAEVEAVAQRLTNALGHIASCSIEVSAL